MPMIFKIDVLQALKEKGYTTTVIRSKKILSESTLTCIRNNKAISWKAIETICELLDCQPGDILEFKKQ